MMVPGHGLMVGEMELIIYGTPLYLEPSIATADILTKRANKQSEQTGEKVNKWRANRTHTIQIDRIYVFLKFVHVCSVLAHFSSNLFALFTLFVCSVIGMAASRHSRIRAHSRLKLQSLRNAAASHDWPLKSLVGLVAREAIKRTKRTK